MKWIKLKELNKYKGKSINPLKEPDTVFEMYSVPSYAESFPEIVTGAEIGSTKQTVQEGDILLCKINPRINRVWVVSQFTNNQSIASSEWIVIRNNDMFSRYLMWYFRSKYFRTRMISNITGMGGSLMRAQPKQVGEYLVPVPEYDIQQKIAAVLDKAQLLIDKRKEQIEACDELIKSLFYEMFGDLRTNSKGFKKGPIGKLVEKNIEKVKKKYSPDDQIKYIDISCIDNTKNIITGYNIFQVNNAPSRAQQCLREGDIVISTVRPNLRNIAIIKYNEEGLVGTSGFCVLRSKDINREYLFRYILSKYFTELMTSITSGANYPAIKNSDVLNHEILIPPLELQNKFAQQVEKIEKQKYLLEQSLVVLENNFNSLMQRAFKGELF